MGKSVKIGQPPSLAGEKGIVSDLNLPTVYTAIKGLTVLNQRDGESCHPRDAKNRSF